MSGSPSEPESIEQLRSICLQLPEAEERPFGGHTAPSFRVRDKLFVMVGEDREYMTCKAPPGVQQMLVASDPVRFFVSQVRRIQGMGRHPPGRRSRLGRDRRDSRGQLPDDRTQAAGGPAR